MLGDVLLSCTNKNVCILGQLNFRQQPQQKQQQTNKNSNNNKSMQNLTSHVGCKKTNDWQHEKTV